MIQAPLSLLHGMGAQEERRRQRGGGSGRKKKADGEVGGWSGERVNGEEGRCLREGALSERLLLAPEGQQRGAVLRAFGAAALQLGPLQALRVFARHIAAGT